MSQGDGGQNEPSCGVSDHIHNKGEEQPNKILNDPHWPAPWRLLRLNTS